MFLLQIDPTIYQANMQRAQAAMSQAEAGAVQARATRDQSARALTRTKELREQNPNLISQEQLEQAQTASDIAEANLTAISDAVWACSSCSCEMRFGFCSRSSLVRVNARADWSRVARAWTAPASACDIAACARCRFA